jgi:excisionase family DNA binding protein
MSYTADYFLTTAELADYFRLSTQAIRRLIRDERLPVHIIGRNTQRFLKAEIDVWVDSREETYS